jgi:hypothetical protein
MAAFLGIAWVGADRLSLQGWFDHRFPALKFIR